MRVRLVAAVAILGLAAVLWLIQAVRDRQPLLAVGVLLIVVPLGDLLRLSYRTDV